MIGVTGREIWQKTGSLKGLAWQMIVIDSCNGFGRKIGMVDSRENGSAFCRSVRAFDWLNGLRNKSIDSDRRK